MVHFYIYQMGIIMVNKLAKINNSVTKKWGMKMSIFRCWNLTLERMLRRIHGLVYLFKDILKKPPTVHISAARCIWIIVLFSVLCSLFSFGTAYPAIPKYINFQGRLTGPSSRMISSGSGSPARTTNATTPAGFWSRPARSPYDG